MKIFEVRTEYVKFIPDELVDGVLCVSEEFQTAIHKCPCGCGNHVVTPLSGSYAWQMTGEQGSVTLRPSIGNWSFACQSHYYITANKIEWL